MSEMMQNLRRLKSITAPEHIQVQSPPGVFFQSTSACSKKCKLQRRLGAMEDNLRDMFVSDDGSAIDSDGESLTGADAVLRWFAEQDAM